jgi:hypothetical protein
MDLSAILYRILIVTAMAGPITAFVILLIGMIQFHLGTTLAKCLIAIVALTVFAGVNLACTQTDKVSVSCMLISLPVIGILTIFTCREIQPQQPITRTSATSSGNPPRQTNKKRKTKKKKPLGKNNYAALQAKRSKFPNPKAQALRLIELD